MEWRQQRVVAARAEPGREKWNAAVSAWPKQMAGSEQELMGTGMPLCMAGMAFHSRRRWTTKVVVQKTARPAGTDREVPYLTPHLSAAPGIPAELPERRLGSEVRLRWKAEAPESPESADLQLSSEVAHRRKEGCCLDVTLSSGGSRIEVTLPLAPLCVASTLSPLHCGVFFPSSFIFPIPTT